MLHDGAGDFQLSSSRGLQGIGSGGELRLLKEPNFNTTTKSTKGESNRGLVVVVFSFARSQPAWVETKVGCIQVGFCLSPQQKTCCNCY